MARRIHGYGKSFPEPPRILPSMEWIILSCALHGVILLTVLSYTLPSATRDISPAALSVHVRLSAPQAASPDPPARERTLISPLTMGVSSPADPVHQEAPGTFQDVAGEGTPPLPERGESPPDPSRLPSSPGEVSRTDRTVITEAIPLAPIRVTYPRYSNLRGQHGDVVIRYKVDTAGIPFDFRVMKSSGHERLDLKAIEDLKKSRFTPASKDGIPVVSERDDTVSFILPRSEPGLSSP
ncbi:MAG: energy transducer TonB [Syntrophaceae bacterium]|nr:energy transducer TonB [Deltaproteobacteria bacterium]